MIIKKITNDERQAIGEMLKTVFDALNEKGYDPIEQIRLYLLSEEPHYITMHKNARTLITKMNCEDIQRYLLEEHFRV